MLTCPKCNKEMHPICGNKNCKCFTEIPEGELPMKDFDLLFGKIEISQKIGNFLWHWTWNLNIGYWLEKLEFRIVRIYNNHRGIKKYFYTPSIFYKITNRLGFRPMQFIWEMQRCPYCGYSNSFSYWEDRGIEQMFEENDVHSFYELEEKRKSNA